MGLTQIPDRICKRMKLYMAASDASVDHCAERQQVTRPRRMIEYHECCGRERSPQMGTERALEEREQVRRWTVDTWEQGVGMVWRTHVNIQHVVDRLNVVLFHLVSPFPVQR